MAIRTYLLMILLAIGVAPLLVAALIGQRSVRRLGDELGARQRDAMVERSSQALLQAAGDNARLLSQQMHALTLAVALQSLEAQELLDGPPDLLPPSAARAATPHDFLDPHSAPGDLAPSPRHLRTGADGVQRTMRISPTTQVVGLAPQSSDKAQEQADRLRSMTPTYAALSFGGPETLLWQYVALDSGAYSIYPGTGDLPGGFDPRRRAIFEQARGAAGLVGPMLAPDPLTGEQTIFFGASIRLRSGATAGMTGLELRIADTLDQVSLPSGALSGVRAALVRLGEGPGGRRALLLLGERRPGKDPAQGKAVFACDDSEHTAAILDALGEARPGAIACTIEGTQALVAWAPIRPTEFGAGLLLIAPRAAVATQGAQAQRAVAQRVAGQVAQNAVIGSAVVAAALVLAVVGARRLTRPIEAITSAARAVAAGDQETHVPERGPRELRQTARALNEMAPRLRERLRLQESLSLAMEAQASLLPSAAPDLPGFDIAGRSVYCEKTGGDYFDFLGPRDGACIVAIGDISGHGLAAALFMTTARAQLRTLADSSDDLATLLTGLNAGLARDMTSGRFMTMCCVRIGPEGLTWVSAGHEPPMLLDPGDGAFESLDGGNIPLGVEEGTRYTAGKGPPLKTGQTLVLLTDGILEARSPAGEQFGLDRAREIVRQRPGASAAELCDAVLDGAATFREGADAEDDATVVIIRATGEG